MDNNADSEHRDLLAAYRDLERMPVADRAAVWRRLQSDLTPAPDLAAAPPRRPAAIRPYIWGAAQLAAALLLIIINRPAALTRAPAHDQQSVHEIPTPPPRPITHDARPPGETIESVQPPAADTTPSVDTPPPTPAPPRRPRAPAPALDTTPPESTEHSPPAGDLEQELALLHAARAALARGDHDVATTALGEHATRFPGGLLREERLLLRVESLCAAGARDQARREADEFAATHPRSPHVKKIQRICPAE
jgi:hypothetical protein